MNSRVIHVCNGDSVCTVCDSLYDIVGVGLLRLEGALVALHIEWCLLSNIRLFPPVRYEE